MLSNIAPRSINRNIFRLNSTPCPERIKGHYCILMLLNLVCKYINTQSTGIYRYLMQYKPVIASLFTRCVSSQFANVNVVLVAVAINASLRNSTACSRKLNFTILPRGDDSLASSCTGNHRHLRNLWNPRCAGGHEGWRNRHPRPSNADRSHLLIRRYTSCTVAACLYKATDRKRSSRARRNGVRARRNSREPDFPATL